MNEEKRTHNSIQLARKLREERAVNLSGDRLNILIPEFEVLGLWLALTRSFSSLSKPQH
ncbi:MAG: hypothetical protein AAFY63_18340 [Cyanobacteria bacterium J06643_13]